MIHINRGVSGYNFTAELSISGIVSNDSLVVIDSCLNIDCDRFSEQKAGEH